MEGISFNLMIGVIFYALVVFGSTVAIRNGLIRLVVALPISYVGSYALSAFIVHRLDFWTLNNLQQVIVGSAGGLISTWLVRAILTRVRHSDGD